MNGPAALFPWFLLLAGGLRVETATPDALCPDPAQVRAAVRDRLGELEGTGEWVVSYGVVHHPEEPSGDALRLELRDPRQRPRLRRELPRHGESCAAIAQAIAIVVDNFFRRPGGAEEDDDASLAARDVSQGPLPRRAPEVAATMAGAPAAPQVTAGLLLGWAAAADHAGAAVSIGARVAVLASWTAGLDASWLVAPARQALDAATIVTERSAIARASLARVWRPAAGADVWLGPELIATIDRAQAPGLAGAALQWRGGCGAGVHAGAAWWFGPNVALWLALSVDATPARLAGDFVVRGDSGPVLPPPAARAAASLGVLFAIFR